MSVTRYPRKRVLDMLRDLGHDPMRVSRIVIETYGITVEYIHPLTDDAAPENTRHLNLLGEVAE